MDIFRLWPGFLQILSEIITKLTSSLKVMDEIIDLASNVMSKPMLDPKGPEGTPAKATIDKPRLSIRRSSKLSNVIMTVNLDFAVSVNMLCMLTLVVEHHLQEQISNTHTLAVLQSDPHNREGIFEETDSCWFLLFLLIKSPI